MSGPALLIFCDDTEIAWLRWLRPGFRHVFVALPAGGGWITIDPLSTRLEVEFHPLPADADLAGWFRRRGHAVLPVARRPPLPAQWPLAPFTCVAVAKRALGIRAPFVFTPWGLYRHLGGPLPFAKPRPPDKECPILARLVSTPKPRAAAVPVVGPAVTAAPVPAVTASTAAPSGGADAPTAGEQSLLRRTAGRAGTVLTGWRGVLAPGALAPARKTLLGE